MVEAGDLLTDRGFAQPQCAGSAPGGEKAAVGVESDVADTTAALRKTGVAPASRLKSRAVNGSPPRIPRALPSAFLH